MTETACLLITVLYISVGWQQF